MVTTPCIDWAKGSDRYGRGVAWRNGRTMTAPRMVWEQCEGPIPKGLFVLHTCDRPSCVNPAHLWLGTPLDNNMDTLRKGRWRGRNMATATRDDKGRFV